MIPMPPRHSVADEVARAASKCLRFACERHFQHVRLADVAQIASGGTPSTSEPAFWNGDVIWVTPKDLGRPRNIEVDDSDRRITQRGLETSATLLPIGTVLLSSRAPIGHLGIASVPLCTNQGFKNIICSPTLNNRYLFHILRASIEELDALGHGNTFKEIPAKVVREFEIALPPFETQLAIARFLDCLYKRLSGTKEELPHLPVPLSEQKRIVARIEELAAQIEEARGLRRQAVEEASALVISTRANIFEHALSGFEGISLGEFADVQLGKMLSPKSKTGKNPRPYLRNANVQWDRLDLSQVNEMDFDEREAEKFTLRSGDILVCEGGVIGRAAIWNNEIEGCLYQKALHRVRVHDSKALPRFILHSLFWGSASGKFFDLKTQTTIPHLPAVKLKRFQILLPPLSEQRRIAAYLDELQAKVDAVKRLQAETSAELKALLPSVLDRAFKGEL